MSGFVRTYTLVNIDFMLDLSNSLSLSLYLSLFYVAAASGQVTDTKHVTWHHAWWINDNCNVFNVISLATCCIIDKKNGKNVRWRAKNAEEALPLLVRCIPSSGCICTSNRVIIRVWSYRKGAPSLLRIHIYFVFATLPFIGKNKTPCCVVVVAIGCFRVVVL